METIMLSDKYGEIKNLEILQRVNKLIRDILPKKQVYK